MLGVRTQGPYLWSRASRAGVQPPSRWPGRTEARASAAPSPKPCCGPWVPGRLLSARPSGFGPGRLHPSPPRVRAFLPRASQAGSLRRPLCRPFLRAPVRRSAAEAPESGLGRPAGRRDERGGGGGRNAGRRAGGRVPGSPAPMGREAGAGALCRSDSRAATPARGKEPYPHPCVVLGAACCARPPASALGSLGTKVEPLVPPLSQAPETVAVHHQGTWKTKDLGHKSETRQRLRKSTSPP